MLKVPAVVTDPALLTVLPCNTKPKLIPSTKGCTHTYSHKLIGFDMCFLNPLKNASIYQITLKPMLTHLKLPCLRLSAQVCKVGWQGSFVFLHNRSSILMHLLKLCLSSLPLYSTCSSTWKQVLNSFRFRMEIITLSRPSSTWK